MVLLLALAAIAGGRLPLPFVAAALIATVAIDLDHAPGLLGSHLITGGLPRPYSHGIGMLAALLALAAVLKRGRQRQIALGLAFGVAAHLLRDVATGPGVPLLWPLSDDVVKMPYVIYPAVLALVSFGAALRTRPRPARRRRSPLGAFGPCRAPVFAATLDHAGQHHQRREWVGPAQVGAGERPARPDHRERVAEPFATAA